MLHQKRFGKKPQGLSLSLSSLQPLARKRKGFGKGRQVPAGVREGNSGAEFRPNFPKVCFVLFLFVRGSGHDASEVEAANLGGFVDLGRRDLGRG